MVSIININIICLNLPGRWIDGGTALVATSCSDQSMFILFFLNYTENDVDGDAFLALDKDQIKALIPRIDPQAKFNKKRSQVLTTMTDTNLSSPPVRAYCIILACFSVSC